MLNVLLHWRILNKRVQLHEKSYEASQIMKVLEGYKVIQDNRRVR